MWEIILKYLEKSQAASQFDALQNHRPDITKEYGKHFNFAPLLKAYQTYIDNYQPWTFDQHTHQLIKVIGGEQRHVPAWYIYAFCEEGEEKVMWPAQNILMGFTREYSKNHSTSWNTNGSRGSSFAHIRWTLCNAKRMVEPKLAALRSCLPHDLYVTQLVMSRQTEQLDKLQASLLETQTNEKRLEKGFKK